MYARVVRFTDVSRETIDAVVARIEASDGPPPGVPASGVQLLFDADQGTALFMATFDSMDGVRAADEVLGSMDASETPGTRTSVDRCEAVIEREA